MLKISSIFRRHRKFININLLGIQTKILLTIVHSLAEISYNDGMSYVGFRGYIKYCMQDLKLCMPEYCIEYDLDPNFFEGCGWDKLRIQSIHYNGNYVLTRESNYSKSRFSSKIFPRDLLHILQCFLG